MGGSDLPGVGPAEGDVEVAYGSPTPQMSCMVPEMGESCRCQALEEQWGGELPS